MADPSLRWRTLFQNEEDDKYEEADEFMEDGLEDEYVDSEEEQVLDYDNEPVLLLNCRGCGEELCSRAMRVVLIADNKTELFSTDQRSRNVSVHGPGYTTQKCLCEIRDIYCLECGNVVGYHVCNACVSCLGASNNGHYWLFQPTDVTPKERKDDHGRVLTWGDNIPSGDYCPAPKQFSLVSIGR